MRCPEEGVLQAYVDKELSSKEQKAVKEHVESCSHCRLQVNDLIALDQKTSQLLHALKRNDSELDPQMAWKRFERQHQQHQMKRGWRDLKKSSKRWIAGLSAAAATVVLLSIPQVQAMGQQLLSIFRVSKVEMVKITREDIQEIESWLSTRGGEGVKNLRGIGEIKVKSPVKGEQHKSFDTEKAAKNAGFATYSAPKGYHVKFIEQDPAYELQFKLDTAKANALFKQLRIPARFDDTLNKKEFSLVISRLVSTSFASQSGSKRPELSYRVSELPKMKVPQGVDMQKLRKTVISLPFIPYSVRSQLAGIEDWETALPMPMYSDKNTKEYKVTIQGVKGVVVQEGLLEYAMWQKDGKLHFLDIYEYDGQKKALSVKEVVDLANQIRQK